jgi:peptidoglycan/LPS O-acetylase OafA/YrhL
LDAGFIGRNLSRTRRRSKRKNIFQSNIQVGKVLRWLRGWQGPVADMMNKPEPTADAQTAIPVSSAQASSTAKRNAGLDALRATLTLLVLFHHTAITYGALGGWFYREVPFDGKLQTSLLTLFCSINQAYFMGAFFLLAGYFTPGAVARHGASAYVKERLLRLGVPLLVFGLLIGPATFALAQTAEEHPFLETLLRLWAHLKVVTGPLWFAQALLIFSFAFLAWRWLAARWPWTRAPQATPRPFPTDRTLAIAALATGAAAFALRLLWPVGTDVLGLQLGYFASYVVLFAAGCIGAAARWLNDVPEKQARLWRFIAWLALPVLPAVALLAPHLPALQGDASGGWNLKAAVYAFWEPLVAWGLILTLLRVFTRRFAVLSPIWAALTRRAYAVYIIHPPILVALALAWRSVEAPHLVKFAVTGTATCLVSFLVAGLLLRVPAIRRIV